MSVAKNFLQSVKETKEPYSLSSINQMYVWYVAPLCFVTLWRQPLNVFIEKKELDMAKHIDAS